MKTVEIIWEKYLDFDKQKNQKSLFDPRSLRLLYWFCTGFKKVWSESFQNFTKYWVKILNILVRYLKCWSKSPKGWSKFRKFCSKCLEFKSKCRNCWPKSWALYAQNLTKNFSILRTNFDRNIENLGQHLDHYKIFAQMLFGISSKS